MNFAKRAALAAGLTAAVASSASADPEMQTIEFNPNAHPTIECAATFMCEIRLERGEHVTRAWHPQVQIWGVDAGTVNGRPVISFKPETPGLYANFIVLTDKREYELWMRSYDIDVYHKRHTDPPPFYTQFVFDREEKEKARHQAAVIAALPKPSPTPRPLTVAEQMDRACASMPVGEQYGIDREPRVFHPEGIASRNGRGVCHSLTATYIQMPLGGPEPTVVPSLVEDAPDGVRIINAPYDPQSRIFKADDVAEEYALVVNGKRLRIQRQVNR